VHGFCLVLKQRMSGSPPVCPGEQHSNCQLPRTGGVADNASGSVISLASATERESNERKISSLLPPLPCESGASCTPFQSILPSVVGSQALRSQW
jgi:hypothetical protein